MLNSIIRFSLFNRLIVLIVSAVLLVGGTLALINTEVDIFPDLNAPTVAIMTEAPGLATEEVEQLVTYPVEMAVNGAQGVEIVRSMSTTGFSVVNVQFTEDTDILVARQTVSERLAQLDGNLTPAAEKPVIGPQSSILGEIMIIGLTSDSLSMMDLRSMADRRFRPTLQGLSGVSSVSVIGGEEREYQIVADPGLMKHFDVTLADLLDAVADANANSTGGVINSHGNEYVVKGEISTVNPDELAMIVVKSGENGVVTVADIAKVEIGGKEPRIGAASYRGKPAVLMTVTKQPGVGTIELTKRILSAVDDVKASLPSTLNVKTDIFSQSDFIDNSISSLGASLFEGALMVIIVLFFFMMNSRATIVSLLALPMSIIVSILILNALGLTINTMSLGGIAIAIGSLVDDAIVDVENVYKRLRQNAELPENERRKLISVVFEASKEVRMPIFNSSLIIVAGFLPLFFLSGVEGRMLVPLGISFIVALAASTIVALTLTPVLCFYLLGAKGDQRALSREPKTMIWLKRHYGNGLRGAMRHKRTWLCGVGLLFAAAAVMFATMGGGFLPPFNEGSFTINVSSLPGVTLEQSDEIGRMAEEAILAVPEVQTVARKTGRAELDEHSLGTNVSEIEAPYKLDGRSHSEVVSDLRKNLSKIPGVVIEIGQPISHRIDAMLSGTEAPVVVKIFGDDLDRLNRLASSVKGVMGETDGFVDIAVEQQIDRPEISIRPRRSMMARYGVTPGQFNDLIETALAGRVVSQVYEEGFPRDLTVKFDSYWRQNPEVLKDLTIDTQQGKVPLSEVAEVVSTSGPNSVSRENASRRIIVAASVDGRDLASAVNELKKRISEEIDMPEGYTVHIGGRAESAAKSTRTLALASLLAFAIIFILLFHEFKNVKESLIILVNMPLAMIGGVFILWITGGDVDIPAIIGFIALIGIATRNGMLLISRYNHLQAEGLSFNQSIFTGSVDRLTPIVMTALTSALALIPLALRADQPGNEIQSPLALVIIGGLVSSTLLNLFVVPIIYYLCFKNHKPIKE